MAATSFTVTNSEQIGNSKIVWGTVTLTTTYTTGGDAITLTNPKIEDIEYFHASGGGYTYEMNAGKLKVYQGDNTNAAAAPGVEVTSTTNLSAVTNVRFLAIGQ